MLQHEQILIFKTGSVFSRENVTAKTALLILSVYVFPVFIRKPDRHSVSVSSSGLLFPLLHCKFLVIIVSSCAASYLSRELGFLVSDSFLTTESLLTAVVTPNVQRSSFPSEDAHYRVCCPTTLSVPQGFSTLFCSRLPFELHLSAWLPALRRHC